MRSSIRKKAIAAPTKRRRLQFNSELHDLVCSAPLDREKAKEALAKAAAYMERDKKLPYELAAYLSRAIRGALEVDDDGDFELRKRLGLAKGSARKVGGDEIQIGRAMESELEEKGNSVNAAAKTIAKRYGISVPTAKRRLRAYRAIQLELSRHSID